MTGTRSATRTQDLLIKSEVDGNRNALLGNILHQQENARTVLRAVYQDKPLTEPCQDATTALFFDLAAIVAAWPSIPEPIRAAVKAVLAPYMFMKGQ